MQEMLDLALKKIAELEKRTEKYYDMLFIENELDFIMKGSYYSLEDLQEILDGTYSI